jgi:hypothetical protein
MNEAIIVKEKLINAQKSWIWEKLIDVENWSEWDVEVKESRMYSSFNKGEKGYLIDQNNSRSEFEITEIDHEKVYSNKYFISKNDTLNFNHKIIGEKSPYLVVFEAYFSGNSSEENYEKNSKVIIKTMENALNSLEKLKN